MSGAPALVTEAEFLALPETTRPLELLDGEVIMAPSPSFWHQEIRARLVTTLRAWASGRDVTVAQAPLDVRFGVDRILQPDAMVFLTRLGPQTDTPVKTIPDVCIEVLSTNRAYDRITKRFVFAEAGVTEYWIVDPARGVERWHGPGLSVMEVLDETLSSPLLPGFELDVRQVLTLS